ncbi:hypothetical protein [uncultured Pseudodesulfovibrio sp.]|uniref:hypothetical protein n=1 Tax=uncultured Pseudodesulfovibrio sp. TaxID=2035858 RepID=UPI0029C8A440|nr:hypothetical protein [uncultured Pseudodesulfovibrio sp.]
MTDRELAIRKRLRDDFKHFSQKCLKIRAKKAVVSEGKPQKIIPFLLNRAQDYINGRLDEQKERIGRVRALVLKGRQQGVSTLVGGRFYHKTTHRKGVNTFILTHRDDATNNLFKMTKRFHKNNNPLVTPSTSYSNRKELVFDKLDSSYSLGTAGGDGEVGRSDTIDFFHGSEVAFWKNPQKIQTGVFQAANEAEEIILESTANGFDPMFHPMWQAAEAGIGEYIAVFVPWFWQDEYTVDLPDGWEPTAEESELFALYEREGMTWRHLAWRRSKIASDFAGDEVLFKQEYPCCAAEAFQVTGHDSFIKPESVIAARKRRDVEQSGARIVGVDPARGGDRTSFYNRQGRVAWAGRVFQTPDTKAIIGEIVRLFTEEVENPVDWMFIDIGGLGGPIYDQVKDMPFGRWIVPVNFGSKEVFRPNRYVNKRAEMWGGMRDWTENDAEPVCIEDSDSLQSDLCAPGYTYDNQQRILLESKEQMAKRGQRSPDEGDALALTFAQPVMDRHDRAGIGIHNMGITKVRRLA